MLGLEDLKLLVEGLDVLISQSSKKLTNKEQDDEAIGRTRRLARLKEKLLHGDEEN
jgi:hypothetical protein